MKKRGFGTGKWNGYGGKVQEGETVEEAALREMREESGLVSSLTDLERVGVVDFHFNGKPDWSQRCHVFLVKNWQGEPVETEEMQPQWFASEEIPYDSMWLDDKHWLPAVLSGKQVEAEFHFLNDGNEIEKFNVNVI